MIDNFCSLSVSLKRVHKCIVCDCNALTQLKDIFHKLNTSLRLFLLFEIEYLRLPITSIYLFAKICFCHFIIHDE
jgi:hypothetical protein